MDLNARTKLIHAMKWLNAEPNMPAWAQPGVYFALRTLDNARATFFSNAPHRSNRCARCAEIEAIAQLSATLKKPG